MRIDVPTPDGTAEAWLARPDPDGPHPGVVLFMDAIGLRPRIHDMADRIASWGYVVLAPNVFYREGSAAETSPDGPLDTDEERAAFFAHAMPRVGRLTPELAGRDLDAYLTTLLDQPGVTAPLGVVGYCMGARLAVRAACARPEVVAACGGFHGGGLATEGADSPHVGLARARAAFAFGHADADPSMDRRGGRAPRDGADRRRAEARQPDLPGRPARLHDGGHFRLRRDGHRAALLGAAGLVRRRLAVVP